MHLFQGSVISSVVGLFSVPSLHRIVPPVVSFAAELLYSSVYYSTSLNVSFTTVFFLVVLITMILLVVFHGEKFVVLHSF